MPHPALEGLPGMREDRQTSTVAMGSGPDVARESADVMLLGNNLVMLVGHLRAADLGDLDLANFHDGVERGPGYPIYTVPLM
jgi:hypothetical protein